MISIKTELDTEEVENNTTIIHTIDDIEKFTFSYFTGGWSLKIYEATIYMDSHSMSWSGIVGFSNKKPTHGKKWRLGKNQILKLQEIKTLSSMIGGMEYHISIANDAPTSG